MKKLNNKGFGLVEGLLIVVALGIIGGSTLFVFKANESTKESLNNTGKSEIAKQEIKKVENKESPTVYLSIKEWGVKVPQLPKGNVLNYKQRTDNIMEIVSSEQKALGGDCGNFSSTRFTVHRASNNTASDDEL